MPRLFLIAFAFCLCAVGHLPAAQEETNILWYPQPAAKWTDALPIGNGRLGAMIFGGVNEERIQFNEDTLWTGHPHDYVRTGAGDQLATIRQLLADGKNKDAVELARTKFLSDPVRQKAYQPFGDLRLHFTGLGEITDYRRQLDLDTALTGVSFRAGGVAFKREAFASYPDHAIVWHVSGDQPGKISFTLIMDSSHTNSRTTALSQNTLSLVGQVETGGLKFESRVHVNSEGGSITANGNVITVTNADSATLYLVAATSFKNFQDISGDPAKICAKDLKPIGNENFPAALAIHLADYKKLFSRVSLNLGRTAAADLPTDERLRQVHQQGLESDPSLAALYFQYGRYLLISSSRPGGQPANLQGIWNDELSPPWESKWTLNINCEMNYWPAEVCNLTETTGPLFAMIDDLSISGARTAKEQYGARGWVVHHNTDLWRGTAPINNIDGIWPTGGAWLCYHLWEHYLFTGDKKFLARAYPVMKSASQFFMDSMVKDPKTGWLVTSPSFSPEEGGLCIGPTMDHQLIRALMDATLKSAAILKTDKNFSAQLAAVRQQVAPDQIGKHGQLQEWLQDVDVPNNNHRHMSPLWALYPGAEITPAQTNLFAAAKVLLKWRGDGSTGWSYAWRIPLWARVNDGDFAFQQFDDLLQKRTLPNLFDLCGPFQIDGNFGACAGVAEIFLQSQQTENGQPDGVRILELLPALPKAWPAGSVTGLCARGGFEANLTWRDGVLKRAVILSKLGNPCIVRYASHDVRLNLKSGGREMLDGNLQTISNEK
jgi:alpha-L-fucosidase 2